LAASQVCASGIYITEWMYNGDPGEFIEFTNLSGSAVDSTGWSYDDDSKTFGVIYLSGFGVVGAGESVIVTEAAEAEFREAWGLESSPVKVLGGYTNNLSRADEINLYDASNKLADRLTCDDETIINCPRTKDVSGWPRSSAALGANDVSKWGLSEVGDAQDSYTSTRGDIGNPGVYSLTAVPVPGAIWLLGSGLACLIGFARRCVA